MLVHVVTGSRDWSDVDVIASDLAGCELLIVGDCPTGADAIALRLAREWDIIPKVLVADWRIGKGAGPLRNAAIAQTAAGYRGEGLDVHAFAYPIGESTGTRNCIGYLERQGFAVTVREG